MSDFLTQVAARTLNTTPLLRPVLGSMFEPTAGARGHASLDLVSHFEERAAQPTPSTLGDRSTRHDKLASQGIAPIASPVVPIASPLPSDLLATNGLKQAPSHSRDDEPSMARGPISTPAVPLDSSRTSASVSMSKEEEPPRIAELPVAPAPRKTAVAMAEVAGTTSRDQQNAREVNADAFRRELTELARQVAMLLGSASLETSTTRSAAEFSRPRFAGPSSAPDRSRMVLVPPRAESRLGGHTAASASMTASVPSAAPTMPAPPPLPPIIRVTIGRVDIHAATEQPSPTRTPSPSKVGPTLTLQEYLRQREGERR